MLIRIFLLLVLVPLVEMILLLWLADRLGFTTTLAMILATGAIGAWLVRWQGLQVLTRIRAELAVGRLPAMELLNAVLIVTAGALLLTPGILTDGIGIALLIPVSRSWFRRRLVHWFRSRWKLQTFSSTRPEGSTPSEVIDSYVVRPGEEEKGH